MLHLKGCTKRSRGQLERWSFAVQLNLTHIVLVSLCLIASCISSPAFAHLDEHIQIELVKEELKKDPNNLRLLVRRARLYRIIKHYQQSLGELNNLAKKYPDEHSVYLERSRTNKELKNYEQAESDLTQVIQLGGDGRLAFAERAQIREILKQFQPAIEDYQSASQYPQDENFYFRFARLYQRLEQYKDAANAFRKGLKKYPGSIILTTRLIRLEIDRKNYEQAHQLADTMLQKRSFKTPWLLLQGEIYEAEATGLKEKAAELRRQALRECDLRIKSKKRISAIHRAYRAKVLLAMGNLEEADKQIEWILDKFPDYHTAIELKQRIESKRSQVNKTATATTTDINDVNAPTPDPTPTPTPTPCTASTTHVESIVCSTVPVGGNKKGRATVTIHDNCGNPVFGATVTGTFTGDYNEQQSGDTDGNGVAVIDTVGTKKGNVSFTFCVDSVTHATLTYDPNDNNDFIYGCFPNEGL